MKKFLSLVLALVMTMSLVTVAAGAKIFTDDSKITYIEAVDVMSGINAIDGYADGDFQPATTLTRGAAAKIICNLILGPTTAGALAADKAPFKDVPANHTFAGYIAYCASQGIINGYADKSFKPGATVTGFQFLKMLLGALGYDANAEQFVGGNWSVNVAKLAMSLKLTAGNDEFIGTKAVTREEACLYAFNTLKATMVEYDTTGSQIDLGNGASITTKPSKASDVKNSSTENIKNDDLMQFAEKYFGKLKLTVGTDDFERPANTWNFKSTNIGTYSKTPDVEYTAEVKLGTIYSELGLGKALSAANVEFHLNGKTEAASGTDNGSPANALTALGVSKGNESKIGGNGTLTEVYYDSDAETLVVTMVNSYYAKVTAVRAATATKDAYITVSGVKNGTFETTDFAVDDLVVISYSDKDGVKAVKSVEKAETVTGTLTGYTANKNLTVGGTVYSANATYKADLTDANLKGSLKYDVIVTLDQDGYAINVDTTTTSSNYAVVLDEGKSGFQNMAQLLMTDGTVKDVKLAGNSAVAVKQDIVSYTSNSKDEYKLEVKANTVKAAITTPIVTRNNSKLAQELTAGSTGVATSTATLANGKTIFLVATKNSAGETVYNSYTGIKNVPTITPTEKDMPVTSFCKPVNGAESTTATVIFIDATKKTSSIVTSSKDVIFVKGSGVGLSYDSVKGAYYVYDAIVNGEIVKLETATENAKNAMYTEVSYDSNKIATLSNPLTESVDTARGGVAKGTVKESNGVIGLGNSFYSYAKDCKVFLVDTDGNINVSSVAAIVTNPAGELDTVYFKMLDGDVTSIVVVQYGSTSKPGDTTGYTINKAFTATATTAKVTLADGVIHFNGAAPAAVVKDLTLTVKVEAFATATGTWNLYASKAVDTTISKDGALSILDAAIGLAAGTYRVTATLTGGNVGTMQLYFGNVTVAPIA